MKGRVATVSVTCPTHEEGCPWSLALGDRGYRYDARADFNSRALYIYDAAFRLSTQRSVRPRIDFYRQRTRYRIRQ